MITCCYALHLGMNNMKMQIKMPIIKMQIYIYSHHFFIAKWIETNVFIDFINVKVPDLALLL